MPNIVEIRYPRGHRPIVNDYIVCSDCQAEERENSTDASTEP
jgi:hypothetical protein